MTSTENTITITNAIAEHIAARMSERDILHVSYDWRTHTFTEIHERINGIFRVVRDDERVSVEQYRGDGWVHLFDHDSYAQEYRAAVQGEQLAECLRDDERAIAIVEEALARTHWVEPRVFDQL